MGDLERVIRCSKRFEAALTRRYGAQGRGLHEKISDAEARLDPDLVRDLRFIATIRNKLVHEEGYDRIDDRAAFARRSARAAKKLRLRRGPGPVLLGAGATIAALTILGLWAIFSP